MNKPVQPINVVIIDDEPNYYQSYFNNSSRWNKYNQLFELVNFKEGKHNDQITKLVKVIQRKCEELLESENPTVIILDGKLNPNTEQPLAFAGREVLIQLKAYFRDRLPIVIVTQSFGRKQYNDYLECGATDVLNKNEQGVSSLEAVVLYIADFFHAKPIPEIALRIFPSIHLSGNKEIIDDFNAFSKPVFITGETGVGKWYLIKCLIHQYAEQETCTQLITLKHSEKPGSIWYNQQFVPIDFDQKSTKAKQIHVFRDITEKDINSNNYLLDLIEKRLDEDHKVICLFKDTRIDIIREFTSSFKPRKVYQIPSLYEIPDDQILKLIFDLIEDDNFIPHHFFGGNRKIHFSIKAALTIIKYWKNKVSSFNIVSLKTDIRQAIVNAKLDQKFSFDNTGIRIPVLCLPNRYTFEKEKVDQDRINKKLKLDRLSKEREKLEKEKHILSLQHDEKNTVIEDKIKSIDNQVREIRDQYPDLLSIDQHENLIA